MTLHAKSLPPIDAALLPAPCATELHHVLAGGTCATVGLLAGFADPTTGLSGSLHTVIAVYLFLKELLEDITY